MAKVSPNLNSFNAGEYSPLVQGRVDLDRYPASVRGMLNHISVPQGPMIGRSGTEFKARAFNNAQESKLIPFVYDEDDVVMLELTNGRVRFHSDDGIQVGASAAVTNITANSPMVLTIPSFDAVVNSQIVLSGLPAQYGINGLQANVTAKVGNVYTLDISYSGPLGVPVGVTAATIYSVAMPYAGSDVMSVKHIQSLDVVYLFCEGYRNYKLERYSTYDWRLVQADYINGPFAPAVSDAGTLVFSGTQNAAVGGTATASSEFGGHLAWQGFSPELYDYWLSTTPANEWLQYAFTAPRTITGYTIFAPVGISYADAETPYTAVDVAPGTFDLLGSNDGVTWVTLDSQIGFVLYNNNRSVHFKIKNTTPYAYVRLHIISTTRNGPKFTGVACVLITTSDDAVRVKSVAVTGSIAGLNRGAGFKSADVGRLIRVKGTDGFWRVGEVSSFTDNRHVGVRLLDEPLLTAGVAYADWQIGYFGGDNGWPTCGTFFEDRLWLGGIKGQPDLVCGSRTGDYSNFEQRSSQNEVLDDHAFVGRLNGRKMANILWMNTDERGLLIGTGSSEWVLSSSSDQQALTARNVRARASTERGSAKVDPVKVDRQILFVQRTRRTLREMAYVYEADGYKSPSMSLFAAHLGAKKIMELDYAAEPHTLVWMRMEDGSIASMTYNRDENAIGWAPHSFTGFVRSIAVLPSVADNQDALWMVVDREIDGGTKRYIEKLKPFWDTDSVIGQAWFVDSGAHYAGTSADVIYGFNHLEGQTLVGLANDIPVADLLVTDGAVTLPFPATVFTGGLYFPREGESNRPEVGAQDGTAQGKVKRMHNATVHVWASYGGELGIFDEDSQADQWVPVEYPEDYDQLHSPRLFTGMYGPSTMPPGYNKAGSIKWRQTLPLPFNVIAFLPQMNTQDR